jgi:hypothetical protein
MIFWVTLISLVAALLTFELGKLSFIGPIRASAGLTLLVHIDLALINSFTAIDVETFAAAFFGASFVGMASSERFNHLQIALAGFLFALLFTYILPWFAGIGGLLGFSAFLAVSVSYLLEKAYQRLTSNY